MSSKETRRKGGLPLCTKCQVAKTRDPGGVCYSCRENKMRLDLITKFAVKYPIPIPLDMRDKEANCFGDDPELFTQDETPQIARDICQDCPLNSWCLDFGLWNDQYGTWGGLSQHERRVVKKGLSKSAFALIA